MGEEGYYTGKVLETVEDCKAEVLAEIQADVLKDNEVMFDINTEQ